MDSGPAQHIFHQAPPSEARLQQVADAQKEIQTLEAEVARVEAELKVTLEKNVRQAL